jgi:ATP-binding cassette subfamily F protein 3
MRLLSGEEPPDAGERLEGHQVVMQYFAQDESTRLDPALTVYETLASGSPQTMIPAIRNILGGFLFTGDDVYKKVAVLSGGERTRLAVARMLLRPSNTLLLDEPTNHLDLDSKEVLLDALADYGGTLVFVSHDRYFVERLATKIVEVGGGKAPAYPGTYSEFLWSKQNSGATEPATPKLAVKARASEGGLAAPKLAATSRASEGGKPRASEAPNPSHAAQVPHASYDDRKKETADRRKRDKAYKTLCARIAELETRIADREQAIQETERVMAAPGFYDDHLQSKPVIDRHQALMWEVGDLLGQWEMLQGEAASFVDQKT